MRLTRTYPIDLDVLFMCFNILPSDILIFTSYTEADLNQSIGITLGVVMEKSFTYTMDSYETIVSYVVSIFCEQMSDHTNRINARGQTRGRQETFKYPWHTFEVFRYITTIISSIYLPAVL